MRRARWVTAGIAAVGLAGVGVVGVRTVRARLAPAVGQPGAPDLSGAPYPLEPVPRAQRRVGGNARVLGRDTEPAALRWLATWVPPTPQAPAVRALTYAWAAPMSLAGLVLGAASGSVPEIRDGVLLFARARGLAGPALRSRGFGATALGHVVVAIGDPSPSLLAHELVHVRQAERLGPLFAPLYLGLLAAMGYTRHPLERAARLGGRRTGGARA